MDAKAIVQEAQRRGIKLRVVGDKIRFAPKAQTPPEFVEQLRQYKAQVMALLRNRQTGEEFRCWVLEEWRRVSIPDWRRILQESIEQGDEKREEYARWMLREALFDSEYEEPEA